MVENYGTFWIIWVVNDHHHNPYISSIAKEYLSLDKAKKIVENLLEIYGEDIITIWIEHRDTEGNKIAIPFHKVCLGRK